MEWILILPWELGGRFGVPESLLAGVANTHVDYVLHGQAPLNTGTLGPPNHILSPSTIEAGKDIMRTQLHPRLRIGIQWASPKSPSC
jgi:hypothetical protein